MPPKASSPGTQNSIVVRIEDVDITNRLVHAFDKTQGRIQVSFRDIPGGGLLRIPIQGEKWIAERVGYLWRLKSRLSSIDEQTAIEGGAAAGDAILSTPTILHIIAEFVNLHGRPLGATTFQTFSSDTGFTGATLSTAAYDSTIQVYINGVLLSPDHWTYDGGRVSFDTTYGAGVGGACIVYYQTYSPTGI